MKRFEVDWEFAQLWLPGWESRYSRLRLLFRIDEAELKRKFGPNENKKCSRLINTKVIDLLWETKIALTVTARYWNLRFKKLTRNLTPPVADSLEKGTGIPLLLE